MMIRIITMRNRMITFRRAKSLSSATRTSPIFIFKSALKNNFHSQADRRDTWIKLRMRWPQVEKLMDGLGWRGWRCCWSKCWCWSSWSKCWSGVSRVLVQLLGLTSECCCTCDCAAAQCAAVLLHLWLCHWQTAVALWNIHDQLFFFRKSFEYFINIFETFTPIA